MKRFICTVILAFTIFSLCAAQSFNMQTINRSADKNDKAEIELMSTHYYHAESFADFIAEFISEIWLMNTIFVSFDDYPYASDSPYLHFSRDSAVASFTGDISPSVAPDGTIGPKNQFYRFAADTSFFYFPNLMAGNQSRFEGLIWKFFGPIFQIDTFFLMDDLHGPKSTVNTNLQLGLQFSLVQTSPFSLYWTVCWNRMQFMDEPVMNGVSFQLIARSYPTKPLLLEWRGTLSTVTSQSGYYDDELFLESHLEIGMMITGPLEAYAAWRFIKYPVFKNTSNGFEAGVRYHL